jgi:phosphatidylglycerol:prolipoprotein diacylglycerol transferase
MVHRLDPIVGTVFGMHLWWYGLSYTFGLFNAYLYINRHRARIGLTRREALDLSLLLSAGVLLGGRILGVYHQWPLYEQHPELLPAVWLGGFATHGLIIGGAFGILAFCAAYRKPFRNIMDALAVPAAIIMGFGRIGNFIDGQIVGSLTTLPWGVDFPYAEGFRHPVVLYDGLKNLVVALILSRLSARGLPPGRLAALFVLLYAGLRMPIDLLREYPTTVWGLPGGQTFNLLMAVAGVLLLLRNLMRRPVAPVGPTLAGDAATSGPEVGLGWRRTLLAAMLVGAMVIPSDAARDIPAEYGTRHEGLVYSTLYPELSQPD